MVARMRWRDKAQEWLADRVGWVQYPNIRQIGPAHAPRRVFRYAMPASTRITLVLLGLMALAFLLPILAAVGFFLYAFLGAVFGWI
ncbi:hypothetical protein WT25_10950 [Burkholderia territorii]|nr:hypothetical protein WT25_10950 [Burkholderia territorii]